MPDDFTSRNKGEGNLINTDAATEETISKGYGGGLYLTRVLFEARLMYCISDKMNTHKPIPATP